jgi:hypothetical protein
VRVFWERNAFTATSAAFRDLSGSGERHPGDRRRAVAVGFFYRRLWRSAGSQKAVFRLRRRFCSGPTGFVRLLYERVARSFPRPVKPEERLPAPVAENRRGFGEPTNPGGTAAAKTPLTMPENGATDRTYSGSMC